MIARIRAVALAAVAICGVAASGNLGASTCSSSVITYTASGTFGPNVIQGKDGFDLAGEPFTITIISCESKQPTQSGSGYANYSGVQLTGSVSSALITEPYEIMPTPVNLTLVRPATGDDVILMKGMTTVFGELVSVLAAVSLPHGTLTSLSLAPFPEVSVIAAKSWFTMSYPSWQASTPYASGMDIVDPSGNLQRVDVAGTSGATAPVWNDTVGGTTTDGTVVWMCEGAFTPTGLSLSGTVSAVPTGAAVEAEPR
jgi:hypothetical protein